MGWLQGAEWKIYFQRRPSFHNTYPSIRDWHAAKPVGCSYILAASSPYALNNGLSSRQTGEAARELAKQNPREKLKHTAAELGQSFWAYVVEQTRGVMGVMVQP